MARPPKTWTDADVRQFKQLCGIFCTRAEVCQIMDVDPKTLNKLIAEHMPDIPRDNPRRRPTFADAWAYYSAQGRASIRRKQFEVAMDGDRGMLIFLGKQYLGQREDPAKKDATPSTRNGTSPLTASRDAMRQKFKAV